MTPSAFAGSDSAPIPFALLASTGGGPRAPAPRHRRASGSGPRTNIGADGTDPDCSGSRTNPSTTGMAAKAFASRWSPSGSVSASFARSSRSVSPASRLASAAGDRSSGSENRIAKAVTAGFCAAMISARSGIRKNATSNRISVARPAASAARRPSLNIVSLRDLGEFCRIAEHAIDGSLDGFVIFEPAERRIDLGSAGAEQLRKFALGKAELQRNSFSGFGLAIAERNEQKTRQTHFDRVEGDRLQLIAGVPDLAAKIYNQGRRDRGMSGAEFVERAALEAGGEH